MFYTDIKISRIFYIPGHFGVHGLSMAGLMIKDEASPRGPRGREAFCFFSIFSPKIQVLSAGLQVGSESSKYFVIIITL